GQVAFVGGAGAPLLDQVGDAVAGQLDLRGGPVGVVVERARHRPQGPFRLPPQPTGRRAGFGVPSVRDGVAAQLVTNGVGDHAATARTGRLELSRLEEAVGDVVRDGVPAGGVEPL